MKKLLTYVLGTIYSPVAIIWSVTFGILIGILGKAYANYLDFKYFVKHYLREWKQHPKKSYNSYIGILAKERTKNKLNPFVRTAIIDDTKYLNPKEPFPFFMIITLAMWHMFLLPIRCTKGIIDGPLIIYEGSKERWLNFKLKLLE